VGTTPDPEVRPRVRRRPLVLEHRGGLRWSCYCAACKDLLIAELAQLTDGDSPTDTIVKPDGSIVNPTPIDESDTPASWRAI
jgi:hypothetical protein